MEKILLSQEVAEALETIKKLHSIEDILETHAVSSGDAWNHEAEYVNELNLTELATALIVGYEVKLTANEIIMKDYNSALKSRNETTSSYKERFFDGYLLGVESTLETLEIEIDGIK